MDTSDEEFIGPWKEDEKKMCKLVVIGRNIDKAYIREEFDKAVWARISNDGGILKWNWISGEVQISNFTTARSRLHRRL